MPAALRVVNNNNYLFIAPQRQHMITQHTKHVKTYRLDANSVAERQALDLGTSQWRTR